MAILRVIIVGDKTTHGGTVIQGSHGMSVEGKAVSLKGDLVSCPLCKGNFPIIQGAKRMSNNGRGVALEGMKTACGAVLIGTQNLMWVEDDFYNEDDVEAPVSNSEQKNIKYASKVLVKDKFSGEVLAHRSCEIEFSSGAIVEQETDENGYLYIQNSQKDNVIVRVLFMSPKRQLQAKEVIEK